MVRNCIAFWGDGQTEHMLQLYQAVWVNGEEGHCILVWRTDSTLVTVISDIVSKGWGSALRCWATDRQNTCYSYIRQCVKRVRNSIMLCGDGQTEHLLELYQAECLNCEDQHYVVWWRTDRTIVTVISGSASKGWGTALRCVVTDRLNTCCSHISQCV